MSTHRVVEKLDVVEHICPGFVSCFVNVLLDSLGLQQREKALGHCIVMAIAAPTHARLQVVIAQELSPIAAGVLNALVGMHEHFLFWFASPQRHHQCINHQV